MSKMLKSSGAMAVATLLSRVLGMARETLYSRFMGDGMVAAAFKMAFLIPNMFRRLLGEGALTAAFIPIFKDKEKNEGEERMWDAANAVISALIVAAALLSAVVVLGLSVALALDSPSDLGFAVTSIGPKSDQAAPPLFSPGWLTVETRLMLQLLRIMFPYVLLICLAAIFIGMLNARGQFFVPAMGATVLNVILIGTVCILWFAPGMAEIPLHVKIFGLALAVLVAGAAQAAYQLPALRREGYRFRWINPLGNETVREVARKMIPGMIGVAAFQLNILITQGVAYAYDPTIFASFDYAVRLMELPQGVCGISLATYLLPTLAGLAADKNYPEFRSTVRQAVGYLAFINLLASVLLLALAEPMVRLLFQGGAFTEDSTARASFALACLAPGLVAFSLVHIFARAFYALGDTATPMKISAFCLAANVLFTLFLIGPFKQGGLGIANSMSAALNCGLLVYGLRRKLKRLDLAPVWKPVLSMMGAAVLAGAAAWLARGIWEARIGHAAFWARLGEVFVPMALAGALYIGALSLLKIPEATEVVDLALRRLKRASRKD